MTRKFASIAFTPKVIALQEKYGSAASYQKFLSPDAPEANSLRDAETDFIKARDGFYQATISETGWPYVQFRGGPKGFLKVIDEQTIAFADYKGNRQYLSTGNLQTNDRISLILMDYPNQRRLKIWGRVTLKSSDEEPDIVKKLHDPSYKATPERAYLIHVEAYDWNCPQHIPQRLTLTELEPHLAPLYEELETLRAENKALKAKHDN